MTPEQEQKLLKLLINLQEESRYFVRRWDHKTYEVFAWVGVEKDKIFYTVNDGEVAEQIKFILEAKYVLNKICKLLNIQKPKNKPISIAQRWLTTRDRA